MGQEKCAKLEPTVILDPPKQGALMREEIFGPLLRSLPLTI